MKGGNIREADYSRERRVESRERRVESREVDFVDDALEPVTATCTKDSIDGRVLQGIVDVGKALLVRTTKSSALSVSMRRDNHIVSQFLETLCRAIYVIGIDCSGGREDGYI